MRTGKPDEQREQSAMRILLITLALTFLFSTPTLADIEVGDIVINRTSGSVNVRINMHNPGPGITSTTALVTGTRHFNHRLSW